jgi:hypothetical protein
VRAAESKLGSFVFLLRVKTVAPPGMIVTTTAPGPGTESCAYTWLIPVSPITATITAMKRLVMTSFGLSIPDYCGARTVRPTIGQEGDRNLIRASEVEAGRGYDADLILLADGRRRWTSLCFHFPEVALDLTISSHMLRHRLSFPRGAEITARQDLLLAMLRAPCGSTRAAPV